MYKGYATASADASPEKSQKEFYRQLAEEKNLVSISSVPVLRATKKQKTNTDGKLSKFCAQVASVSELKHSLQLYA